MHLTLTVVFALLACVFAVLLFRLRRSLRDLGDHLGEEPVSLTSIPESVRKNPPLLEFTEVVVDALSEANLSRDVQSNQRLFLQVLLDEIQDAILIINSDGTIRFANKVTSRFFENYSDFEGREFISICMDHRLVDILEEAWESGEKKAKQITHRFTEDSQRSHREEIWQVEAERLALPRQNSDGAAWLLIRNITHEVETEQIRRDFVANASHELRTPLSIITGYIETLSDCDVDLQTDFAKRSLKTMEVHGERISRIVDDMLTISKLERFDDLLKRKEFNLLDSIETMITHLNPLIEEQGAKVKVEAEGKSEWNIYGDRFYWDQIFFNLIENSLKQNQTASKLKVTVQIESVGEHYHISVCDNGVGIPSADLPLVFKRFYRVEKHHARTVKGTGLGLSIVKRAVESHHGTIKVESQPGTRTCFLIDVPAGLNQ